MTTSVAMAAITAQWPIERARWEGARARLCMRSAALAPALAAITLHPTGLPTAAVDAVGRVFVNAAWSAQRTAGEIHFVLLHEVLHLVLRHHARRANRDAELWNIAGDLVINDLVAEMARTWDNCEVTRPEEGYWRERDTPKIPAGETVETVYRHLVASAVRLRVKVGLPGGGCGVIETPAAIAGNVSDDTWRELADRVRQMAAACGEHSLAAVLKPQPRLVAWTSVLRAAVANAASLTSRDLTTWRRVSRRSPPDILLPGVTSSARRVAVVIDTSGSMSDDDVSSAIAETQSIVDTVGVPVLLVTHDHAVRAVTWLRPGTTAAAIAAHVGGRGGTLFSGAYTAVEAAKASFDAIVHMTDGAPCEPWPARPRNCRDAIAALTPTATAAPAGWRAVHIAMPHAR